MVDTYRATIHFEDPQKGAGWSFSLWRLSETHVQVLGAIRQVALLWTLFLPPAMRIWKLTSHREGSLRGNDTDYENLVGEQDNPLGNTDSPWMGARVYLEMADRVPAVKIIRCFRDDWINYPDGSAIEYSLKAPGLQALDDLCQWIIANDWQIRVRETPNVDIQSPITAIGFSEEDNEYVVTYSGESWGFVPGDRVFIGGDTAKLWPNLRGWNTVKEVNGLTLTIKGFVDCTQEDYAGGLRLFKENFIYEDIIGYDLGPLSRRKVGASGRVQRGRRSKRRRAVG